MAAKLCLRRLQKEMRAYHDAPPAYCPCVHVDESDIHVWYFVLEGPPSTPYHLGTYVGKLVFPPNYPFAPPAISMLTPSGRFATQTRLCLSMSDFHPESWNPLWSVASIVQGVLSFMVQDDVTTGAVETIEEEKLNLARGSLEHCRTNGLTRNLFPEYYKERAVAVEKQRSAEKEDGCGDATTTDIDTYADVVKAAAAVRTAAAKGEASVALRQLAASLQIESDDAISADTLAEAIKRVPGQDEAVSSAAAEAYLCLGDLDAASCVAPQGNGSDERNVDATMTSDDDDDDDASCARRWNASIDNFIASGPTTTRACLSEVARLKEEANAKYAAKDYDAAISAFENAVAYCPIYSALYSNMAAAFALSKKHAEAVAACDVALRLNPSYEKAQQRRAISQKKLGT